MEDDGGRETDGRAKGVGTAVIAHGDAAPVLDATKHDLDFMALFVQGLAVARLFLRFLRGGMQGVTPFFFKAVRNRSAA